MDHALNSLRPYVDVELRIFIKEWESNEYIKYSECPSYDSLKVLIDAANIIRKYMGIGTLTIREMIKSVS